MMGVLLPGALCVYKYHMQQLTKLILNGLK